MYSCMRRSVAGDGLENRLPPGQVLVDKFPVLSYGPTPRFNPQNWDLRIFGMVKEEIRLSYQEVRALPLSRQVSDFHCVTTWSRLDSRWEGVRAVDLMKRVQIDPLARHAIVHCDGGYTTNFALEEFLDDDVMLAWGLDGRDLEPDHGWPLRLVVPKLYGWKSAKWVRAIELVSEEQRGFWEIRGYHKHGDPWREERYSFQEDSDD
jgi:DMSO/TMAO reductase YedYZ molybdopterin-dependent catalytic subunit